jgi:putative FmdB family regulatory protein
MPIYDYTCSACGHLTEVLHGINDHGPRFCPECGAEGTMTKGFAPPTIHYKGTGWAKKDRSSAKSASRSKPDDAKSDDAKSDDAKSGDSASDGATPGNKGAASGGSGPEPPNSSTPASGTAD